MQKDGVLKHVPLELQDYEMLSVPNFDFTYDRIIASKKDDESKSAAFASRNHLFGSVLNVTGSAKEGKLANTQVSLQRNDYIKRPFEHPLHPKQYWVGDVITNPANLVSNSAQGVGFTVSNIPPGWKIDFNNLNIIGQSVPNWSIEIYVNNNLFDFSTVNASGVYSFQNIPLNAGLNTVKLVFYGPYGQRREVVEKVNLDSKLLQKGKVVYEVSGVKSGRSILETDEQKIANALTRGDRYYTNVRYGVGDKTSLAVGATSYERSFDNNISNPEQNTFLHSSLTTTFQSILLNMDLAHQTNTGGSAVLLSFNTPVFSGSDLFASSQIFTNDFVSEIRSQATGDTAWRSNNIFRFTTGVNVLGRYISNIYTVNFTTLVNGNITYVQSLRNAVTLFPFLNISNVLNLNQNLDSKIATGVTNVTLRHGSKLLIRGSLGVSSFFWERRQLLLVQ
jgi:hypothetical protein